MGCCGNREKEEFLRTEQKWDYINLNDFKSSSCLAPLAYGYLWVMLIVSISVYAVDTFTCVNLLVFDKWSGQIQPAIKFSITRWIFTGCILLSFILLLYRWLRAIRVMKQGGVAKSYLDPLAVRIQSIRMGKEGRGWRRFLVFAELTKSRKGADYVALFSYFSFEAWLRIVFAEGPRQVVNALTLYAVLQAKLIPEGDHAATDGHTPFVQFWFNIGELASQDKLQATILLGMLWTLLIWVFSALSLITSVVLYLIFLWHHIPSQDGSLTVYCRRKINRRMERIVKVKVDKALKQENELRARQEAKAAREGRTDMKKQPTLPKIATESDSMSTISRQDTISTLPEYQSRPESRRSNETVPPLPTQDNGSRPLPQRHATQASDASWASYNSNAPLMSAAGDIGYVHTPIDSIQTPASAVSTPWSARPATNRSATGFSQFSEQSFTPGPRPPTSQSFRNGPGNYQMEHIPRAGTAMSNRSNPRRQGSDSDNGSIHRGQTPGPTLPYPVGNNGSYFPPIPESGRSSPAMGPPNRSHTPQGPLPRSFTPQGPPPRSFTPQGPPPPRSYTPADPIPRSVTAPMQQTMRSFTPSNQQQRSFTGGPPPDRSFTPGANPPPLPRLQSSNTVASTGYKAYSPQSTVTSSTYPNQSYHSYEPPHGYGNDRQNEDSNRDSGFDDILNHYRR